MGIGLSASEVVKVAIRVEKAGRAYYTEMASSAGEEKVRGLCRFLAEQEGQHVLTFETIQQDLKDRPAREQYEGEFGEYVKALIDARIFSDESSAIKKVKDAADSIEAVDNAIAFEKDTILLMNEMRGVMPPDDVGTIEKLIGEEKKHIRLLAEVKSDL